MSSGLAPRVALVVVAVVGALWFADGLRAVTLVDRGKAEVEARGPQPDDATAREALALFRSASKRNPDPTPRLEEAAVLLAIGRERPAAALLEDIARANPGSIRAWGLLSRATATFDEERSTKANGERLALYGRVQDPLYAGTLRGAGRRRYTINDRAVQGNVDDVVVSGRNVVIRGWAARLGKRRPAEAIVVTSYWKVVQTAVPSWPRPDLVRQHGATLQRSGFVVTVPLQRLRDEGGDVDVHVFGAGEGWVSRLPYECKNVSRLRPC